MTVYQQFLAEKRAVAPSTGIERPGLLPPVLFEFQADITRWALRRGRAAVFAGTGLGKTLMELAWADAVQRYTQRPVLILTPLAVAPQFIAEAERHGLRVPVLAHDQSAVLSDSIAVTNYQKLAHFDPSLFGGVVLDESSILKSFDGATRAMLVSAFAQTPFRLAATATPAPNDFMELGNHAEFLGVMGYAEMLAMFFVHDSGETQTWRLRGHASSAFWRFVASWAVMLRKPSDLGYSDDGFVLPPLRQHQWTVEAEYAPEDGFLFPVQAHSLSERLAARRQSVTERCAQAAALVRQSAEPCVVWCNLNAEADELARLLPDAVEVRGSDPEATKEQRLAAFAAGSISVLITKPSICGFGLNWQHCARMVFVGLNDSWEQVYQATRRCWRFGQRQAVDVHFVAANTEGAVVSNLKRKEAQADQMAAEMVAHMQDLNRADLGASSRQRTDYSPTQRIQIPTWLRAS